MAARKKHGVEKKSGGYLPKFMMYDRYVVVIIFSVRGRTHAVAILAGVPQPMRTTLRSRTLQVGLSKMAMEGFLSPDHFMFWTTLFYMKMLYGLLAFPFLIFSVPLLGRGMHGAITTAYDQSGASHHSAHTRQRTLRHLSFAAVFRHPRRACRHPCPQAVVIPHEEEEGNG